MSDQQPYFPPVQPPAFGAQEPARESNWPKVIGIIMICLGAYGVIASLFGIGSTILAPKLFESMADSMPGPTNVLTEQARITKAYSGTILVTMALHGSLAGLLLAAGIGLLRRRRWAIGSAFLYAVLRIIHGASSQIILLPMTRELTGISLGSTGTPNPLGPEIVEWMVIGSVGLGIGIAWALPVFLLIWLRRSKIRQETAAWT